MWAKAAKEAVKYDEKKKFGGGFSVTGAAFLRNRTKSQNSDLNKSRSSNGSNSTKKIDFDKKIKAKANVTVAMESQKKMDESPVEITSPSDISP